ncbi:MAG: hypothetical protein EPN86_01085 [Nanoarchaeota archaeon]|nr:MAG: hypothetical protein EPN86_01085 [Nanoarchaeota archaeon]
MEVLKDGLFNFKYEISYGHAEGEAFTPSRTYDEISSEALPYPSGPDYQLITIVDEEGSPLYSKPN